MLSLLSTVLATVAAAPLSAPATLPLEIPAEGATLSGTLTLPAGPGPRPVAVLISGLGPLDRDSAAPISDTRPFRSWASALARRGVATIRYDTRGVGESEGAPLAWLDAARLAADARAGARRARQIPYLDPARVALVGHSQGGTLALRAAAEGAPVAAVATVGAPGRPLAEVAGLGDRAAQSLAGVAGDRASASTLEWDPRTDAHRVRQPLLVLHGTADRVVPPADALRIVRSHPGPTRLRRIDGGDHFVRVDGRLGPIDEAAADAIAAAVRAPASVRSSR